MLLCLRARKPQDAPHDLLDGRRRARFLEAAKHVGKRAVPTLAQLFHRQNESHPAFRRSDVRDAFQLFQPADGNLHLVFRDIELLHEPAGSGSQSSTRSAWSSRIGRRYSPVAWASATASASKLARRLMASESNSSRWLGCRVKTRLVENMRRHAVKPGQVGIQNHFLAAQVENQGFNRFLRLHGFHSVVPSPEG